MMRKLRPALPVLMLLISGVLGVPAGSAQSKGPVKKKAPAAASTSKTAPSKGKAATSRAPAKATAANSSGSSKPASAKRPAAKSGTKNGTTPRSGKKGSARTRRQPGQKAPTSDRISEIQAALAKDGSFAGTPNGKWDDDTVGAMRRYQASHGLNPTGKLDALTLQKLGLGSQTAGVAAPTPPPGATSRLTSSLATSTAATEVARRQ